MLSKAPISAVLPVVDLARAHKFYEQTLGLKHTDEKLPDDGYTMFEAGEGTNLLLYQRPAVKVEHTQACFTVGDLESEMKDLRAKGMKFEDYDFPGLKTVNGVAAVGNVKSAWFLDTEGNILSLTQY